MTIAQQLRTLFAEWPRDSSLGFISDGVVDERTWATVSPKILYLMKEPNSPGDRSSWSMCDDFLVKGAVAGDGTSYTWTWGLGSRWARGLTEGFLSWQETTDMDYSKPEVRRPYLRRIASVNLKKTGGGGSTPQGSLRSVVEDSQDFLRRQIAIIAPDIVVCCGTGNEFKEILYPSGDWQPSSNGVRWSRQEGEDWLAIEYCHPQARFPHNFLYTMLIDAVRKLWVAPRCS